MPCCTCAQRLNLHSSKSYPMLSSCVHARGNRSKLCPQAQNCAERHTRYIACASAVKLCSDTTSLGDLGTLVISLGAKDPGLPSPLLYHHLLHTNDCFALSTVFLWSSGSGESKGCRHHMVYVHCGAGQHQVKRTMMTGSRQRTAPPGGPAPLRAQPRPVPAGARHIPWTGCCASRISLNASTYLTNLRQTTS